MIKKIIAVDPGLGKSGVAMWEYGEFTTLAYLDLYEVFLLIDHVSDGVYGGDIMFIVENSDLVKESWHGASGRSNVGKNKAISKEIVLHLRRRNVAHVELKPDGYSKVYAGSKRLYFAIDTGWKGVSNEHNRAAAAMVLRYLKNNNLLKPSEFWRKQKGGEKPNSGSFESLGL